MNAETDLFGDPLGEIQMELRRRRQWGKPNGYARLPGSGPKGETCKTCFHACRVQGGSKAFYKCGVIQHRWTHGAGTDIRLQSPACSMWKKEEP